MKVRILSTRWPGWFATTATALVFLGMSASGLAAKGGIPGPPTGGEASNNLSMPSIQTQSSTSIEAFWAVPEAPVLGVHYSYGCDAPETDGSFSYPNTSCVDNLTQPSTYYTAAQCTDDELPSPCQGMDVSRIYWQKVDVNEWWADDDGVAPNAVAVAYVDWGDALEAVSWTERSVIRVETQPYSNTIPGFDPTLTNCAEAAAAGNMDPATVCKLGFQMWHVSGQGITEHWGARATDLDDAVSFNYDSPFQIIKSTNARLNLTKLGPATAACSMPGGNPGDEPPVIPTEAWNGGGWDNTCEWYDEIYSVETSVGGKYVYGYNLRMGDVSVETMQSKCGTEWVKTGFWRLTFYAPDDVLFNDPLAPNVAPPAVPSSARTLPLAAFNTELAAAVTVAAEGEEDPDADDRLYKPVVDEVNNLTYLDICVVEKSQGGGGGNGGGGSGGGTDGGGTGGGGSATGGGR